MTALNPPSFVQGVATETAAEGRLLIAGLVTTQGIVGSGDLLVTQNGTANMSVNVAAGAVFIAGTESTTQGTYHCYNDATVNLAISVADATNPRIDVVVGRVQDAFYSGATNAWSLAVITGTPAPSPAPPALPASSIALAQVAVAANATSVTNSNITDKRAFQQPAVKMGGVGTAYIGTSPALGSTKFLIQAGSTVVTTNASGGFNLNYPVAFPTGVLSVVCSFGDNTTGNDLTVVGINANSTAGAYNGIITSAGIPLNAGTVRLNYIAIGW